MNLETNSNNEVGIFNDTLPPNLERSLRVCISEPIGGVHRRPVVDYWSSREVYVEFYRVLNYDYFSFSQSVFYGMFNDKHDFWEDDRGTLRPRRSSGSNPWSGLWFSMVAQDIPSFMNTTKPGVMVNNIYSSFVQLFF